jgi:hypothetical protein
MLTHNAGVTAHAAGTYALAQTSSIRKRVRSHAPSVRPQSSTKHYLHDVSGASGRPPCCATAETGRQGDSVKPSSWPPCVQYGA